MRKPRIAWHGAWAGLPAGAKVVVDTAPIIYFLQDHPQFAARFAGLFEAEAVGKLSIALSTITLAEVLASRLKQGQAALASGYEKAFRAYELIPFSATTTVAAARLRSSCALNLPDAIQLATALETGAQALVTHDRDFSAVRGLQNITGAEAPRSQR